MNALRDLFHGLGNAHLDLARVGLGLSLLSVIALQGYALVKGQTFDPSSFGVGLSTVLGAGGLGISLKDRAAVAATSAGSSGPSE